MNRILLFLISLMFSGAVCCQCPATSTQGRDFWVMFLQNFYGFETDTVTGTGRPIIADLSLIAAADSGTVVFVENPRSGWDTTVTVGTTGVAIIPVPSIGTDLGRYATNQGLHVTSSSDIALYASNYVNCSFDIATILPTSALDTTYMAQTYPCEPNNSFYNRFNTGQIGFVATEDSTVISMTLAVDRGTYYGPAGSEVTQLLQRGQTFTLGCAPGESFSGQHVTSNGKPFAMFQGGRCIDVPVGNGTCDHLFEQTVPSRLWGKRFVVIPTAPRVLGDKILVTSSADYCRVRMDDQNVAMLSEGQTCELEISSSSAHLIETTQPVYVCLYMKGCFLYGSAVYDTMVLTHIGDPMAVTIPPIEQGVQSTRFHAFSTDVSWLHYVNIAVQTRDAAYMMLDGQSVGSAFKPMIRRIEWDVNYNPDTVFYEYSYAQLEITPGPHLLSNSRGKFVAHFYGLGDAESYAYIAGMATRDLSRQLFVNDVDVNDYHDDIVLCQGDTAQFRLVGASMIDNIVWLVDSIPVQQGDTLFAHYFTQTGKHRVDAVFVDICDTLTAFFDIRFSIDSISTTICKYATYSFGDMALDSAGVYSMTTHDVYGCDSLVVLELTVMDELTAEVFDTFCPNSTFLWNGKEYTVAGDYVDTISVANGCDTVATLHLTALPLPVVSISVVGNCIEYSLSAIGECTYLQWSSSPDDMSLAGQQTERVIVVSPSEPTQYTLTASFDSLFECYVEHSLMLTVTQGITAQMQIVPPTVTTEHPSFDATDLSDGSSERIWYIDGEAAGSGRHLHYSVPPDKDSVTVMLVVGDGYCFDSVTAVVPVIVTTLWVPNSFTPSEETNNRFAPVGKGIVEGELYIYNRQGLQVFHTDDWERGWDGKNQSSSGAAHMCPQATYVWLFLYRTADQPQILRKAVGTVTLLL